MITLNLTLDQVNGILTILGKAPYENSAELIHEIRNQAIPQLPKEEEKTETTKE